MVLTYKELADHFAAAAASCRERLAIIVAEAAVGGAEYAKDLVGHKQSMWDELAESTINEKRRLGFRGPDFQPLLRDGEMRDSIQGASDGLIGMIGSDDPVLFWQELGTVTIPPRPITPLAIIEYVSPFLEVECEALAKTLLRPKAA